MEMRERDWGVPDFYSCFFVQYLSFKSKTKRKREMGGGGEGGGSCLLVQKSFVHFFVLFILVQVSEVCVCAHQYYGGGWTATFDLWNPEPLHIFQRAGFYHTEAKQNHIGSATKKKKLLYIPYK